MITNTTGILILVLVAAAIAFAWYMNKRREAKRDNGGKSMDVIELQSQIDRLKVHTNTPGGAFVLSDKLVPEIIQKAIDDEFANFQQIADRHGYKTFLNPAAYTVLIFPSERDIDLNGIYSPVFKVPINPGSAYDESSYDKEPGRPGGWIYAAERVLDLSQGRFVIAENNSYEYTRETVHNGLDHIVLWHNDRQKYAETADHSQGGGHPILT